MRNGMWVMHGERVGIIFELGRGEDLGRAIVHYVKPADGTTVGRDVVECKDLRQATLVEIPECRRPTEDRGARLGYV